ncbi:MAG TPA: ribosomal protein S18-alanine N-acetyltransferase [Tenericutes bacterium]|nr:ribosomal protein S18-alanine N-acetyltransferase [Mycoplasmatota bacterium]
MLKEGTIKDILKVHELEKEIFSQPTSLDTLKREFENSAIKYYLYEENNQIIGFCSIILSLNYAEIINFGVLPSFQGKGIGKIILSSIIQKLKQEGFEKITLETKKTNTRAISLYKSLGFKEMGKRKGYYEGIDALVFMLSLKED